MSDPSAGQPVTEPVGPPPGPAPTDSPGVPGAPGAVPPSGARPRSASSTVTGSPAVTADEPGSEPPADPPDGPAAPAGAEENGTDASAPPSGGPGSGSNPRRRRRRPSTAGAGSGADPDGPDPSPGEPGTTADDVGPLVDGPAPTAGGERPRIGDRRPAPPAAAPTPRPPRRSPAGTKAAGTKAAGPRNRGERAAGERTAGPVPEVTGVRSGGAVGGRGETVADADEDQDDGGARTTGGKSRRRSGRERRGRPVGRYLMCVHVRPHATQIAVLEGRTLVEHQVSRAADDAIQIDGNIYRGRVQNVLPGMEAAFVDIGTPKNAVLYRGDVRFDRDDVETSSGGSPRIEQMLRAGQTIVCQVTKNPIGAKGARLTQEVSLPGRFVVMVPNSSAFGISKRLDDAERKRLRRIVDDVRPKGHGLIVRTAAEGASQEELGHDVERLAAQWEDIEAEAGRSNAPGLLYREPDLAVRSVREEFNREYRGVVIDDEELFLQVRDYIEQVNPELADRVELYDPVAENMPVFERFHVHEQLHKALDRKVWLPSGGSIIIERTEALTVIDVNTGKNVGTSNLEETVYRNNLEAAEEIARQLRLRDIGGIIVIDFIDMEIRENRDKVAAALRSALARDKTRTQVFDISELGLIEMTRKRVSEGLVESLSSTCAICGGRGIVLDETLL